MEAAVADADAELTTVLGGHRESVQARLWRGRVLVDWEPDDSAGDCLLRPELLRRLLALHAQPELTARELRIQAPGRTVAALSARTCRSRGAHGRRSPPRAAYPPALRGQRVRRR